ncbi:TSA1-like protein isoform X2 [Brassica napus]|uniref:TSA1-like protein isoform X2 n=1 Tax=Brassica oleracea var. oleracea TaxID=109376 RepID=UPI0006A74D1F|nr:PREDICTED: TSA1-like protein isoform X2 [Brassica oleracea var. oleracea]XP_022556157.2 TSA1-like protein isoform X2 [Brassica napus]
MGTKFLALVLSLCLVLSSFYEVSCQDEGTTGLNLDLIDREYQDNVKSLQGNEGEDQSGGQKNSTVTVNKTISLSLSEESVETLKDSADTSSQLGAVTDEVVTPSSMLDHIELEFQAHIDELEKAGSDGINKVDESKDDEELVLAAQRKKMMEEIEREFEAAVAGFEKLKIDGSTQGIDDEQSAMRQSMIDEIERDFEAATKGLEQLKADDLTGVSDAEHAAKRQKMLEEIEREFEEATKGLEELRHSTSSTDDESHSATRTSMLDEIEREFEAATSGLKQLKINAHTVQDDDKEQAARRQSMLDAIEREFEAVTDSFKQLDDLADNKDEGDQSAKRQSMLDEIEREFEAATSSLKKLNLEDSTEGDSEENARRNSMLEAIELEFEAATKGLGEGKASDSTQGKDHDEHSASRKSMLDAIEREFEAATKGHVEKTYKDQAETQRSSMLEEIEREYEAAASAKASGKYSAAKSSSTISTVQKTSGGSNSGFSGLLKSTDGVCGCFNKGTDGLKIDTDCSINIGEILAEESNFQGSESSSLTTSLNNLFHTHRQETTSKVGKVLGSSLTVTSTESESSATSENIDSLKETLKKLRGLSARDLVNHPNFDEIIEAGTRYEVLSSASIGYISLLAKYKTVIKEGLEASQRVHIAQTRAKLLKETAMEKQRSVDAEFAFAKTLAHQGDALSIKIFAIKKLLVKLEAEKLNVDLKFKSTETNLARLLKEASHAYEEYHVAVRKAKDEQAAEEFALETTKRAEHIWVQFLSSLN